MKVTLIEKNRGGVMKQFAEALGTKLIDNKIIIPKSKGGGQITSKWINDDMRILIRNYYLKEEMVMKRINASMTDKHILFTFLDVFEPFENSKHVAVQYSQPKAIAFSERASSVITFPSQTFFRAINISVSQNYLQKQYATINHSIINKMIESEEPFVFETSVSTAIIKCANDLINNGVDKQLETLFYKTKCDELICYFFNAILDRKDDMASSIHIEDIKAIYKIKDKLQKHLNVPPNVSGLATDANMSEPKLRKLFRQTFGKSVFEYYQSIRMHEASRLLREKHLTVSEVGYQLGFDNLSHFGRVFEEHFGKKPKKWSKEN